MRNVIESPKSKKQKLQFGELLEYNYKAIISECKYDEQQGSFFCITILSELMNHFSSKPKAVGSKSHYSTGFVFPLVSVDQGHFLVKNSFSSFAVPTQEMAVTFPAHKVMHLDRRHSANPSNHAAQTTSHGPPEARCYSCCSITFSRSGAERHSEYQKGRKAVLLILWKSSVRSNTQSWLVISLMCLHVQKCRPLLFLLPSTTSNDNANVNSDLSETTELVTKYQMPSLFHIIYGKMNPAPDFRELIISWSTSTNARFTWGSFIYQRQLCFDPCQGQSLSPAPHNTYTHTHNTYCNHIANWPFSCTAEDSKPTASVHMTHWINAHCMIPPLSLSFLFLPTSLFFSNNMNSYFLIIPYQFSQIRAASNFNLYPKLLTKIFLRMKYSFLSQEKSSE